MKNYLDYGLVVSQKMVQNSEKILHEIKYRDKSMFHGLVFLDEETQGVYKEGHGKLDRQ